MDCAEKTKFVKIMLTPADKEARMVLRCLSLYAGMSITS